VNVLAYDLVDVLSWMLGFLLFSTWICLFAVVLSHIVWSQDLSGWDKAFWLVCLVVVPLIGALAYVIARRGKITKRRPEVDRLDPAALRGYGKDVAVASRPTPAVDAARLAELHDRGLLTDEEYVRQRTRALS
jgi:Phospholipase_D-nuclease N-terminal/Short C-terminal domain